jgi:hypothetical protein
MSYGRFNELLTVPIIAGYCEIMMDNGTYADLMTEILGLAKEDFDEHFASATETKINKATVRFLHYNHLIANKKATGRTKDLLDVHELEQIKQRRKNEE